MVVNVAQKFPGSPAADAEPGASGQSESPLDVQRIQLVLGPENTFAVRMGEEPLWEQSSAGERLLPGALELVVQRLTEVSELLRTEYNPQVVQRLQQVREAIRRKLEELQKCDGVSGSR